MQGPAAVRDLVKGLRALAAPPAGLEKVEMPGDDSPDACEELAAGLEGAAGLIGVPRRL